MGLGEHNEALQWLERGVAERDPMMVFLKVDRRWSNLHNNRRFKELLRRMTLLGPVRLS